MAEYTQDNRPIAVTTPLGPNKLLLVGFRGQEGLSQLFHFQLDLLAENATNVPFDQLLGQRVTIEVMLPQGKKRHFNGICNRLSQGEQDFEFTSYRMDIVPQFWFLTRRAQSRIFQQMSVPDILKKVLQGVDVTYELQGTFHPRDYCVQYRETDFNFASRVMEEEGIYYFFKHTAEGHKMVVANTPGSHSDLPEGSTIIYEDVQGGERDEDRILDWEKTQELRSGKYTLWDHSFELPHKHLEADKTILESVSVGRVAHKLKLPANEPLELYDFPGEYAQRFDGVDPSGGDRAGDLQKIFEDNKRTVDIRMQEEALPSIEIRGGSNCRHFVSGHKFTLQRHFNADGQYVLTSVSHAARISGDYRSGQGGGFSYSNSFTCIPLALPFRPQRKTPKPFVQGTQTAVVVGPSGEEIFTDKYSRVKVQFHWDREGKVDANSSCWVRVATTWAGKRWGAVHIPRIGQEVIVAFQEGDPDQPIIIGSVYNAEQMPPYELPDNKTRSGIKSRSSKVEGVGGFNEIRFEDKKDEEQLFIHAERNKDIRIKNDLFETVGEDGEGDAHFIVERDRFSKVKRDEHWKVEKDQNGKVGGTLSLTVGMNHEEKVGVKYAVDATQEIHLKSGANLVLESGAQITLMAGGSFITIGPTGVAIQGAMVLINSGGSPIGGTGASPGTPEDPKEADKAEGGQKDVPPPPPPPVKATSFSPAALTMQRAAQSGTPFCEVCEAARRSSAA
ncbi:MAG: type VI secretion system tip protein VgrG [Deltaproteobacteria bacterium]|nr:type VI secretion system tip protein VgrG [Deltaproteobacteria bacterium]